MNRRTILKLLTALPIVGLPLKALAKAVEPQYIIGSDIGAGDSKATFILYKSEDGRLVKLTLPAGTTWKCEEFTAMRCNPPIKLA